MTILGSIHNVQAIVDHGFATNSDTVYITFADDKANEFTVYLNSDKLRDVADEWANVVSALLSDLADISLRKHQEEERDRLHRMTLAEAVEAMRKAQTATESDLQQAVETIRQAARAQVQAEPTAGAEPKET